MPTFRLRFPLYVQIIGWFFLNILLLIVGVYFLVERDHSLSLNGLLYGPLGGRFDRVVSDLRLQLSASDPIEWDGVLRQFSTNSSAHVELVNPFGNRIAGDDLKIPSEVLQTIKDLHRERHPRPRPQPPGAEPLPDDPSFRGGPPPGLIEGGMDDPEEGPPSRGEAGPAEPFLRRGRGPKFIVLAGNPMRFWVGALIPFRAEGYRQPRPGALLIELNSWRSIGLIFDLTPLWLLAGAASFSALFWMPFVVRITRTLAAMNRASTRIADGQFDVQLGTRWGDELDHLAVSINHLAVQLRQFVTGQKRFLGDIAHELCTPLARMEMALGILEQRADARQIEYVQDVREEVRVMSGLVNELLDFSKAGLTEKSRTPVLVDLSALAHAAVARESSDQVNVRVDLPPNLIVWGQPDLLARAVGNVLRNAIRYAGTAGPIEISTEFDSGNVTLWVRDCGPGVPPEALAKLGEPFFRPEMARTREGGGFGLGLAIVKSCLLACGGSLQLRSRFPTGLEVGLRLSVVANSHQGRTVDVENHK